MRTPPTFTFVAFALAACSSLTAAEIKPADLEFFESRIRPVLVQYCYRCHSAEAESLKGGLRLDHRRGILEGGDSGAAIVPGEPGESLLLSAIRYEGLQMPPDGKLPAAAIRDLEKWVAIGAPDPRTGPAERQSAAVGDADADEQHWAFQPPKNAPVPGVSDSGWPLTPIDHFVLARLEAGGLRPAGEADRERLLRRVTFDLTGLPPTREQIRAFVEDDRPRAFARVVDRLLASRAFGEHWGRHWLDVARYADSNGSDFNATFHEAWRYRDYVIESFNRDKPYDEFVREQLAGDLLPAESDEQRAEQLVATGFLMLGAKMLSERDKEKLRMDVVDEQIDSVGRAFLGLALGCARCHDHKFDPVPTRDYYALAGIFRSTQTLDGEIQKYVSNWVRQPLPIEPEHAAALARHEDRKAELAAQLKQARDAVAQAQRMAAQSAAESLGIVVDDLQATTTGDWKSSTYSKQFFGKGYLHDDNKAKGEKTITFAPSFPRTGVYEIRLAYAAGKGRARDVPIRVRHADGVEILALDQEPQPPIAGLWKPLGRFRFEGGESGSLTISTDGTAGHVIADAAQFIPIEELDSAADASVEEAARETMEQAQQDVERLEGEMKALTADAPPPAPRALAVREAADVGDCAICIRGEPHNRGPVVPRGFLRAIAIDETSVLPADQSGRRELAEWIASPRHPLTARVFVNRVWAHLLGEGLVRTVDNFGRLGEPPTHPELLDHLALEFIEQGWSVKWLVRRIVLSRTYRMDSRHNERAWELDPENRLLWRAHRRALPAESIRDALLAISGQLDPAPGGSPVATLGTLVNNNSADAQGYERKESVRRTVYSPIIRNELPPILTLFDFADPDFVTGQRPQTNVPAQALFLLNSPFVRDCAERIAARLLAEPAADDGRRVEWVYRTLLGRAPLSGETDRALSFVRGQAGGSDERGQHEAWTRLVHAVVASTEFRMVD